MQLDELVEQAEILEESDRITEAIGRWREVIAVDRRPEWLARLGRLCTRAGELEEAEKLLVESVRLAPDVSDAHFYLGRLYKSSDRLPLAREHLERAVALEEWAPGFVLLGEVYRQLKLPVEARQAFERATVLDPNDDEAWYGLGLMCRTEDRPRAIAAFKRSVAIDDQHGAAHRELGLMLIHEKDYAGAEQSVRTALRLNDSDAWAHAYLGNILSFTGRHSEAEAEFRRAITLWPDLPLFHNNLGDALRTMGRTSEAERAYTQALSLDISDYLANLHMGEILTEQGRLTSARSYLERALQAKPNEHRALAALNRLRGQEPAS
jgi:tetratricopeptide (TPR) repeat protein